MPQAADNPRVSVVVTTYNRAALLPRAVDCVLAQIYDDYELIIVDDCSTDDTPAVVRTFEDSRIRVVRHEDNMGQCAARNTGIRLARGEYIAFLDDDDEWVDQKLSRQVCALDSDARVGLVYTWFDHVDAANGVRREGGRSVMSGDISEAMLRWELPAPTSAYLVRTTAARELGGFDEALMGSTDRDFLFRLSAQWHVAVVRDVLMLMHEGQHVRSEQRPGVLESRVRYLESHIRRFDRELGERPSTFARLLRVLAITEMKRGNIRGAARAYSKALATDTRGSLSATVWNLGFICGLLWRRVWHDRGREV